MKKKKKGEEGSTCSTAAQQRPQYDIEVNRQTDRGNGGDLCVVSSVSRCHREKFFKSNFFFFKYNIFQRIIF